jgi:uncharacterized protein (DUF885 family)
MWSTSWAAPSSTSRFPQTAATRSRTSRRLAYADRVDAYARNLDGETERLTHDRGAGVIAPDFTLDSTLKIIRRGAARSPKRRGGDDVARSGRKAGLDAKIVDRVTQSMATKVYRRCSASWTS